MSTVWKLEKDLCRCCHAEGSFKHLSDPCYQLGQEEIYSDMLQDCLDIKVVPMTGVLSDVTYTICESCVVRLRDAANFKRQVQDCEERFKDMYSKNLIKGFDDVKDEPAFEESDELKQEFQSVDEDDDDAFLNFDDDEDSTEEQDMITIEVEPKAKGKGKAKPKAKAKKEPPAKKPKKEKVKTAIKEESEDIAVAAVSGEKKKGKPRPVSEYRKFATITEEEDGTCNFACNVCDNTYKKMANFRQHFQTVHLKIRKRMFPCEICREELLPWNRQEHYEKVHGRERPTCQACGKKFAYPSKLVQHQKIFHMSERNFPCDQCDMTFPDRRHLKRHATKHSDVRKYECKLCAKSYKTADYLRTHLKIHLNDKRYVCNICDEAFVQIGSLKYHMMKHHQEDLKTDAAE